jgi:membrane protease YdiL (CAAX protease family)
MFSELFETFFVVLLVVGVPILSYRTARDPRIRQAPRLALYFSAVLSQWVLAVLGILVILGGPMTFRTVRFQPVGLGSFLRWFLLVALISLAAMGLSLLLERFGWWPEESDLVRLLIPETRREKAWAVLVLAPTAALSEEFLYRGFLLVQLNVWFHSIAWAWAISSVAFGLAHSYQRAVGVLRAAALGALLAYPVVQLGSLYPSMAAHLVIDAVALGWLGPAFLEKEPKT